MNNYSKLMRVIVLATGFITLAAASMLMGVAMKADNLSEKTFDEIDSLKCEIVVLKEERKAIDERLTAQKERIEILENKVKELKGEKCDCLGTFTATGYCNCEICCGKWAGGPTFSGTTPTEGRTIATDPSVIPIGTKVVINNHVYTAEDTGSAIKGNRIDIYFDSHEKALEFGKKKVKVYINENS